MISIKGLESRVEKLLEKADKIRDKWKHGETTDRDLRRMALLYTEASAIAITLKAISKPKTSKTKSCNPMTPF